MAKQQDVHITSRRERRVWLVRQSGQVVSRHLTQRTAVSAGAKRARRDCVDLVTHGTNGRIRSKDSFGNESRIRDTEH